jgi:hypothetical protein
MSCARDDWCYVDSETGSVRSPSFDDTEPELELEPMFVEEMVATPKAIAPRPEQDEEIEVDVSSLLFGHQAQPTK